ncbi:hypothetical protein GCM10011515_05100 [Tsuneonella deserti]|uniref:DUF2834 domain-containing protein n=1 Tax=Tsuneonella deserti TaxID=2035528 RepID=A0ABQ1S0N0_9SPHN|nr:hypothetical protein [Tsuneonella deserti]GGD88417.1 hypothetical protein GCM10011515_05100 [Tsuneonella deserti]
MKPFYLLLMVLWGALAFYTGAVIGNDGLNLFPWFFGDMARWSWPGQFNLDFSMMLFLSASWTAWRNGFSVSGIALAILAFFGGAGFLLPYLTYLAWKHGGDTAAILTGVNHKDRAA